MEMLKLKGSFISPYSFACIFILNLQLFLQPLHVLKLKTVENSMTALVGHVLLMAIKNLYLYSNALLVYALSLTVLAKA